MTPTREPSAVPESPTWEKHASIYLNQMGPGSLVKATTQSGSTYVFERSGDSNLVRITEAPRREWIGAEGTPLYGFHNNEPTKLYTGDLLTVKTSNLTELEGSNLTEDIDAQKASAIIRTHFSHLLESESSRDEILDETHDELSDAAPEQVGQSAQSEGKEHNLFIGTIHRIVGSWVEAGFPGEFTAEQLDEIGQVLTEYFKYHKWEGFAGITHGQVQTYRLSGQNSSRESIKYQLQVCTGPSHSIIEHFELTRVEK